MVKELLAKRLSLRCRSEIGLKPIGINDWD
jgi:hypothetical protein